MGILLASLLFSFSVSAAVISQTVGIVGEEVLTSRQVLLSGLLERQLSASAKEPGAPGDLRSEAGRRDKAALLLETAVAQEAESFSIKATNEDTAALVLKTERFVANRADWKRFGFSGDEIRREALRKLTAKNFIRLRTEAMQGVISDVEAQAYFDKNRVKFGALPFASFKDNIKSFLAKQQLEQRLRSWFEIVRRKHKVREIRSEGDAPAPSSEG
jgi:hypothetical protein